jgi:aerobic carbon-monoxide dehydrogenase medium subunit
VKPAPFRYARPRTLGEALEALAAADGEAKVLAGGQSLVPMLNMRLARPALLVDVNGLPGLDTITPMANGRLAVGAMVRHADLARAPLIQERAPLLGAAARHVGHSAIRNRGTLGGSLAHADPAAELPAAVMALDAELTLASVRGSRTVPAGEFFQGLLVTVLQPDELLTEVHIPSDGAGWGFAEFARRPGDFALAGVAGLLRSVAHEPQRCTSARLVGFGLGDAPVRFRTAENLVTGAIVDVEISQRAGRAAAEACQPPDDLHASAEYRRHLAAVLTAQVLGDAMIRLQARRPVPTET